MFSRPRSALGLVALLLVGCPEKRRDDELSRKVSTLENEVEDLRKEIDRTRAKASASASAAPTTPVDPCPDCLRVTRLPISLNKTGAEACSEIGKTCISVTSTKVYHTKSGNFWGYLTLTCNSRVREKPRCSDNDDYSMDDWSFRRDPQSAIKDEKMSAFCLRQPKYESVLCI